MKINEKQYNNGITLGVIDTKKFKKNYFSLTYVLPMNEYNASHAAVLASVLERGCAKYSTACEMNRKLCEIYDASVGIGTVGCLNALIFKVGVNIIDGKFVPADSVDVFGEALDFVKEVLFAPLVLDGQLDTGYVESEKNRVSDMIRAEVNNKDRFALKRCTEIAYEGTPLAIGQKGSLESVSAVTPRSAYELLKYITDRCKLLAVFSGDLTADKSEKLDRFLNELSNMRNGYEPESFAVGLELPSFDHVKDVVETASARQGRMVLNYSFSSVENTDASPMVFDEIFGSSPVSRLFMNVRERLSLCYYCASSVSISLSRMTVRSGLDMEKRGEATSEIERQIALLSSEENISDEELMMAKKSRISTYTSLKDSCSQYAEWYVIRSISGFGTDVDTIIEQINAVTKADVARIARSLKPQVSYFLKGE